jgi:uncharacterized membrane protein YfhO
VKNGACSETKNYWKVFGLSVLIATIFFLPYIIMDKGLFIYYGDFNVQQIPFYKLAHEAIRSGNLGWNWMTDLGANSIGSYSFYLLGNPFFWLTIPFPTEFVPYLMAPLMILKLACSAVTGYAFIRRFTKTAQFAMIGGLLYAFSGFNIYNIFFNHFLEVAVFFPLLLIALEEFISNRRRGVFALAVCLCAVVNYYFFVAEVIFIVLYFLIRLTSPEFRRGVTVKNFLLLAMEAVLGFLGSMFILLPSVLALMGNYRINEHLSGFNLILYDQVQRYGLILESFFFPPDMPARPNFFPDSASKWASVSAYLPLFSLSAVIAYFRSKKARWIKILLGSCGVIAFVPVLNSIFQLFNSQYYARWFYMPILILALASVLALEDTDLNYGFGVRVTAVFMLSFSMIGVLPKMEDGELVFFKMPAYPERFWAYVLFAFAGIFVAWLIWKLFRKDHGYGSKLLVAVSVMSVIYSALLLGLGKGSQEEVHNIVDLGLNGKENITMPVEETGFYRIDIYEGLDNYGMFWNMPSMRTFHSIVPASIINFYQAVGLDRGVASRADISRLALRNLFSVKYIFASEKADGPDLPNYNLTGNQNEFDVYENEDYIPMGFTYPYYITQKTFDDYPETMRDRLLLKAVLLSDEQIAKYGGLLEELPQEEMPLATNEEMRKDSAVLRENSGSSFVYDNSGFTSKITLKQENLVFYSVPYESGWTATVNGEPAEVEQVSVGFMAVRAPAGENTIRFEYRTPGLSMGVLISLGAGIFLLGYCLVVWRYRKKHPENRVRPYQHRLFVEDDEPVKAAEAYQRYVSAQIAAPGKAEEESGEE